ncbi:MAG: 4Fe-4S binding protein [Planctomycetota bacterium]
MAGKIIINTERCKGCGLCVAVCPKISIIISKKSNKSGYRRMSRLISRTRKTGRL